MHDKLDTNTIIWKSEYNIHNFKLDKEHQELFNIARDAFHISKIKDNEQEISTKLKEIISKLFDYIKTHFVHEEDYMKKINYPYLEKHKKSHKYIMESINDFVKNLSNFDENLFEKELVKIIDITFIYHILKEDKKITIWEKNNLKG